MNDDAIGRSTYWVSRYPDPVAAEDSVTGTTCLSLGKYPKLVQHTTQICSRAPPWISSFVLDDPEFIGLIGGTEPISFLGVVQPKQSRHRTAF